MPNVIIVDPEVTIEDVRTVLTELEWAAVTRRCDEARDDGAAEERKRIVAFLRADRERVHGVVEVLAMQIEMGEHER